VNCRQFKHMMVGEVVQLWARRKAVRCKPAVQRATAWAHMHPPGAKNRPCWGGWRGKTGSGGVKGGPVGGNALVWFFGAALLGQAIRFQLASKAAQAGTQRASGRAAWRGSHITCNLHPPDHTISKPTALLVVQQHVRQAGLYQQISKRITSQQGSHPPLFWSCSTAWRCEKVPRSTSCPLSRTWLPAHRASRGQKASFDVQGAPTEFQQRLHAPSQAAQRTKLAASAPPTLRQQRAKCSSTLITKPFGLFALLASIQLTLCQQRAKGQPFYQVKAVLPIPGRDSNYSAHPRPAECQRPVPSAKSSASAINSWYDQQRNATHPRPAGCQKPAF